LSKYFDYGDSSTQEKSSDEIHREIEECQSTMDFEMKIRECLKKIKEADEAKDETAILEDLKNSAKVL